MAAVAHWGGHEHEEDDSWQHQPHVPTCANTGPVYLNATAGREHCRGVSCPPANPLQRWVVRLPPWAPPGATLPGRLLTLQVRLPLACHATNRTDLCLLGATAGYLLTCRLKACAK